MNATITQPTAHSPLFYDYCTEIRTVNEILASIGTASEPAFTSHNRPGFLEYTAAVFASWPSLAEREAAKIGDFIDHLHLLTHGTYTELEEYFTTGAWERWFADSPLEDSLEYAVAELLATREDEALRAHILSDCWWSLEDAVACLSRIDEARA